MPLANSVNFEFAHESKFTNDVDVLYVAPLRSVAVQTVVEAAHASQVIALSGVAEYIREGVVVDITERRNRPSILINLESAKAGNADFRAELFKVAQVRNK